MPIQFYQKRDKFFKYWQTLTEGEIDKKFLQAKLFYMGIIMYLLFISALTPNNSKIGIVIFIYIIRLIIPILSLLILSDILCYYGSMNCILLVGRSLFNKIILVILKTGEGSTQKNVLSLKTIVKRFIYILVYFFIPLTFLIFLIFTQYISSFAGITGAMQTNQGWGYSAVSQGEITIDPFIKNDSLYELYYFIGDKLNLPIFNICFANNNILFQAEMNHPSFSSIVDINNESYSIPYNSSICIERSIYLEKISYKWNTTFGPVNSISLPIQVNNPPILKINGKIFLLFFILLLAWWEICKLIQEVFNGVGEIK